MDNHGAATVCVVGSGPAGAMLSLLLARSGIDVILLEKHGDFLRDFRGDTVHPATLEVLDELGIVEGFLERPHRKVQTFKFIESGRRRDMVDMRLLDLRFPYVAYVPQWDFLNFITTEAAADGRGSTVRRAAGLRPRELGSSMDIVTFALPREDGDPDDGFTMWIGSGHFVAVINRNTYWHIMYVIHKGGFQALRHQGVHALHDALAGLDSFPGRPRPRTGPPRQRERSGSNGQPATPIAPTRTGVY